MKQTSKTAFAPDWLALREPADHDARDHALLTKAAKSVRPGTALLDLGSGTGSTIRAFEQAGFGNMDWRLLDNDAQLLSLATGRHPAADGVICDLKDVENIALDGAGLVTASALLDLMSHDWIAALANRLNDANLPFYAALNYNGAMNWTPTQPDDDVIVSHFNAHQQSDKGTGTALGPVSGVTTARIFEALGYDVFVALSPWVVGPDQTALHTQFLDGIVSAVADIDEAIARNWGAARKAVIETSQVTVGHLDLLAVPKKK